ncbi:MAG: GtrA family protein [Micropepsaceae bacterium]
MMQRLPPFLRFAFVGTLGFFLDLGILIIAIEGLGIGPYWGRALSFAVTVTFTWALNRQLTFGERKAYGFSGVLREWARFVAANSIGLAVNYGVYVALLNIGPGLLGSPYVAAGCGALAGLVFNYAASSRLVFRTAAPPKGPE